MTKKQSETTRDQLVCHACLTFLPHGTQTITNNNKTRLLTCTHKRKDTKAPPTPPSYIIIIIIIIQSSSSQLISLLIFQNLGCHSLLPTTELPYSVLRLSPPDSEIP
jgi:hypothetical protein